MRGLTQALRAHRLLLAIVISYIAAGRALLAASGLDQWWHVTPWHTPMATAFLLWAVGLALVAFGNRRLRATFTIERAAGALIVLALTPSFVDSFSSLKQALWWIVPFSWDATLSQFSMALHGGQPAYAWVARFLTPTVLNDLDTAYIWWFPVLLFTLAGCAWSAPSPRRTQALVAFALAWIVIGTGLAALFASAGPCYYGLMVQGPDPYAPLLARLHAGGPNVLAPMMQDALLSALRSGSWHPYSGISAMPSMHVAVATWVALWCWPSRVGRWAGVLFVAITQAACVALAWHYAIDGYVAILAMLAIWKVSGRVVSHDAHMRDFAAAMRRSGRGGEGDQLLA